MSVFRVNELISSAEGLRGGRGEQHCCLWRVKHSRQTDASPQSTLGFFLDLLAGVSVDFPEWRLEFSNP